LARETSDLGIRTHILILGAFRTNILDANKKGGTLDASGISDYGSVRTSMAKRHEETHGKQPGDPAIAAQRIVDIVRLENLTEEETKSLSLRIPFGTDALGIVRRKCMETLQMLEPWETFAASTDFPDSPELLHSYS